MRVVLVTHYFPPEIGAPQARLSEFARAWARSGHKVTVVTGMPNHPTGVVPVPYRRRIRATEQLDGYRIVRTWLYATPNEGFLKKLIGHLSFMVTSVALGLPGLGRADVVVVSSPTFFSILSAWMIARTKRARLIIEVRDLWPAILRQLGIIKNRSLIALLERLELAAYRAADCVVVVSEGFHDDIARRGISPTKLRIVRNGVDLQLFCPHHPRSREVRAELGATSDEDVLALYVGAHGISHGLTVLADAAAEVNDSTVRFAFVGEGAAKRDLERRVLEHGLTNVVLRPGVPRERIPDILAAADICFVPLRDVPLFSTFIPSKIFEYLGAGRAVIGSVRGEAAQILEEAGAVVVEPEDVAAITAAIGTLASDPALRRRMGSAGRRYVELRFDRNALARLYMEIFEELTAGSP